MYAPAPHDEITGLVNYLEVQLSAIRAAPLGLTEEQARATPCRSALSVGGIVKHTAYGLRGATTTITDDGRSEIDADAYAAHAASFTVGPSETMAGVLAEFDAAREACLATIAAADPDAEFLAPPAPWFGIFQPRRPSCATSWSTRSRRRRATRATSTSSASSWTASRCRRWC